MYHINEKALITVYKYKVLPSEQLLELDKSFKIHHRYIQSLAIEIFEVKNDLPLTIKKTIKYVIITKVTYHTCQSNIYNSLYSFSVFLNHVYYTDSIFM